MPVVTSRWHLVPSQNFLLDRNVKAWAVHGALVLSTVAVIGPRWVSIVMVAVPLLGAYLGGVPTLTVLAPVLVSTGFQVQATVPAGSAAAVAFVFFAFPLVRAVPSQMPPPARTTITMAPPMIARRRRRCWAAAARSALSFSSPARGAARRP